jgi:hypothetical protein
MEGRAPHNLNYETLKKPQRVIKAFALPWLPIALSIIEIPWYFAAIMVDYLIIGDRESTNAQSAVAMAIATIPAIVGLFLGTYSISFRPVRKEIKIPAMLCAILGLAACAAEITFALHMFWP